VFVQVVDPIESSVVGSPARPGANITGFSHFYQYAMMGKWLGLLKELAPHITRVAVIQNPGHPS
jgi:putative ABC transport system substrate-binding protein